MELLKNCLISMALWILNKLYQLWKLTVPEKQQSDIGKDGSLTGKLSSTTLSLKDQISDGSVSSRHMDIKLPDFKSSVDYEGYRTLQLYLFDPLKYPDESERYRRLEFFIKNVVPSTFNGSKVIDEIRVLSPSYVSDEGLGDTHNLRADWRELKLKPREINFHTIKELAMRHKCLRGMWLLIYATCDREKRDEEWMTIAQATLEDKLGMFAKVSIAEKLTSDENIYINVYTKNFTNKKEVMELERKIRHLGMKGRMAFKPSVYTRLGVHANNDWFLKTGIYTSEWDPVSNESLIQDKVK